MLIPSPCHQTIINLTSLSRRVNANSQHNGVMATVMGKLIKKGEC